MIPILPRRLSWCYFSGLLLLLSVVCNYPQTSVETRLPVNQPTPTTASPPEPTPAPTPIPTELVWFGPNMGSTDYTELFTKTEQWAETRSQIDVFKFYTQNLLYYECAICGDNNFSAFIPVKAFEKLTEWDIAIGVDVGAVKEWGCTGTREFQVAREVIRNVQTHGGSVSFLVMDEPYMGGEYAPPGSKPCGFDMEQTAYVTAKFVNLVKRNYPNILVGNTEPYPYFSVTELEQWVEALEAREITPAFFHLDVNMLEGGRRPDVENDLPRLRQFFQDHDIPFGVIFTSNVTFNPSSDRAYFYETMEWIRTVNRIIGKPQQVIFNSWSGPRPNGVHEIPINLPENDPSVFSHTRLILEGLEVFEGN